jgi:hypothetical protein
VKRKHLAYLAAVLILGFAGIWIFRFNISTSYTVGQPVDSLNGVYVYYNGNVGHVAGRNTTADHYNLGLKYQCVEFVKRYYYEYLNHKMPDSYGHAKDFFDTGLRDGQKNKKRNLIQYRNPGKAKPKANDLLIFNSTPFNQYGHVAIVSKVTDYEIEIIQQNAGPHGPPRETFLLGRQGGEWIIKNGQILGWLRKE